MITSSTITLSTPTSSKNIKTGTTGSNDVKSSFESVFADTSKTTTSNSRSDSSNSLANTAEQRNTSVSEASAQLDASSSPQQVTEASSKQTVESDAQPTVEDDVNASIVSETQASSLKSDSTLANTELATSELDTAVSGNERQFVGQKLAVQEDPLDSALIEGDVELTAGDVELTAGDVELTAGDERSLQISMYDANSLDEGQDELNEELGGEVLVDALLVNQENSQQVLQSSLTSNAQNVSIDQNPTVESLEESSADAIVETPQETILSTSGSLISEEVPLSSDDLEITNDSSELLSTPSQFGVQSDSNVKSDVSVVAPTMEQRLKEMVVTSKTTSVSNKDTAESISANQTTALMEGEEGKLPVLSDGESLLADDETEDNLRWVMDQLTQKGQASKEPLGLVNVNDTEMAAVEGQIDVDLLANKEFELPEDIAESLGGKKQLEQALANLNSSSSATSVFSANATSSGNNLSAATRADSAVAQLTMQSQPNTQAWPSEMATKVSWVSKEGFKTAHIHLDPPELGSLTVKISVDQDSNTQVSFVASSAQAKDALESQIQRLREMLQQQGVALDSVDVEVSQGNSQSFGAGDQEGEGSNRGALSGDDNIEEDLDTNTVYVDTSTKGIDYYA